MKSGRPAWRNPRSSSAIRASPAASIGGSLPACSPLAAAWARRPYPARVLKALEKADRRLLRWLRTRGHQPPVEEAMKVLGKASEWGVLWAVLGVAAATLDPPRRRRWAVGALIGPAAIGVNYAPKLVVKRERPVLR